jgi:hypothetical protein
MEVINHYVTPFSFYVSWLHILPILALNTPIAPSRTFLFIIWFYIHIIDTTKNLGVVAWNLLHAREISGQSDDM